LRAGLSRCPGRLNHRTSHSHFFRHCHERSNGAGRLMHGPALDEPSVGGSNTLKIFAFLLDKFKTTACLSNISHRF
jgi:hypothetical protein